MAIQRYSLISGDWLNLEQIINDLSFRIANQSLGISASPKFAGMTIGALTGVLKASAGVVSGSATFDNMGNGSSTTMRTNLNADLLDGQHASAFQVSGSYLTDETDPLSLHLDQTTPQTIINGVPLMSTGVDFTGSGYQLTNKDYVDLVIHSINIDYFLLDSASGVSTYKDASLVETTTGTPSVNATVTGTNQLIMGWITPVTEPLTRKLVSGIYESHIHASQTTILGKKSLQIYFTLVERKTDNSEITILTSETSGLLNNIASEFSLHGAITADYILSTGSRLVCKWYAVLSGSGGDPGINLYYQGLTSSHFAVPTNTAVLNSVYWTQFTDQTGLTGDKTGSFNMTTTGAIISPEILVEYDATNYAQLSVDNANTLSISHLDKIIFNCNSDIIGGNLNILGNPAAGYQFQIGYDASTKFAQFTNAVDGKLYLNISGGELNLDSSNLVTEGNITGGQVAFCGQSIDSTAGVNSIFNTSSSVGIGSSLGIKSTYSGDSGDYLSGVSFTGEWRPTVGTSVDYGYMPEIWGSYGQALIILATTETQNAYFDELVAYRGNLVIVGSTTGGGEVIQDGSGCFVFKAEVPYFSGNKSIADLYAFYDGGQTGATNNWGFYGLSAQNYLLGTLDAGGYKCGGTAAVADGTYNMGKITPVSGTTGTITVKGGIITAITQAT